MRADIFTNPVTKRLAIPRFKFMQEQMQKLGGGAICKSWNWDAIMAG